MFAKFFAQLKNRLFNFLKFFKRHFLTRIPRIYLYSMRYIYHHYQGDYQYDTS